MFLPTNQYLINNVRYDTYVFITYWVNTNLHYCLAISFNSSHLSPLYMQHLTVLAGSPH